MNILVIHNKYRIPGGEDRVVEEEVAMLRAGGHKVTMGLEDNIRVSTLSDKIRVAFFSAYDSSRKDWVRTLLTKSKADTVHVHNFFPLLTPAIHDAAADSGVAVVQTLHNYRTICAGALLMRDGKVCEKCIGGHRYWGVLHRCYRGSLPGSLAVVRMQESAARHRTWDKSVHRFIALTEFARNKFVEAGFPADRVVVKPNFVSDAGAGWPTLSRSGALFVGRLSVEKGVATLIKAWEQLPDIPLRIAGDGPLRKALEARAPSNVHFLGALSAALVREQMAGAQALIMPSIWYEGLPMAMIESFASGLPVVASRLGSLEELVVPGRTGAHFEPGDASELASVVRSLFASPARLAAMGAAARETYLRLYSPERNLADLEAIYGDAMALSRATM